MEHLPEGGEQQAGELVNGLKTKPQAESQRKGSSQWKTHTQLTALMCCMEARDKKPRKCRGYQEGTNNRQANFSDMSTEKDV